MPALVPSRALASRARMIARRSRARRRIPGILPMKVTWLPGNRCLVRIRLASGSYIQVCGSLSKVDRLRLARLFRQLFRKRALAAGYSEEDVSGFFSSIGKGLGKAVKGIKNVAKAVGSTVKKVASSKVFQKTMGAVATVAPLIPGVGTAVAGVAGGALVLSKAIAGKGGSKKRARRVIKMAQNVARGAKRGIPPSRALARMPAKARPTMQYLVSVMAAP